MPLLQDAIYQEKDTTFFFGIEKAEGANERCGNEP